jgi:hypothetical protein
MKSLSCHLFFLFHLYYHNPQNITTLLIPRYARPWGMHPDAAAAQASKRGSGNEKLITFFGGAVSAVFEARNDLDLFRLFGNLYCVLLDFFWRA